MPQLPSSTIQVIKNLQKIGVESILYGSQGVSLYVGPFKEFGDIDLLVKKEWVENRWCDLIELMQKQGFTLHDEHEHEFTNNAGTIVAFASEEVLVRDKIVASVRDSLQVIYVDNVPIQTLRPETFLQAYKFSMNDGYRKHARGKKDEYVILLLKDYLANAHGIQNNS